MTFRPHLFFIRNLDVMVVNLDFFSIVFWLCFIYQPKFIDDQTKN